MEELPYLFPWNSKNSFALIMKIVACAFIMTMVSCSGDYMDRIRSNREWKVPPCVNSHELVAEQDLNAITDYGYVYTLKVDSGCLRSIINENSMVEFRVEKSVYYRKSSTNRNGELSLILVNPTVNEVTFRQFKE
jgi:hypothetical protein